MCLCVCLSVSLRKPRFLVDWRLLVEECIANIGIPLDVLCIMGELAGGGSVALAVSISDR